MLMALVALCGRVQAVGVLWHRQQGAAVQPSSPVRSFSVRYVFKVPLPGIKENERRMNMYVLHYSYLHPRLALALPVPANVARRELRTA